jgi:hypothetical protein
MGKATKNAFLPVFDLNYTFANFDEIFGEDSLDPLKQYFDQKSQKMYQKYFCPLFCMKCSHCGVEISKKILLKL